MISPRLQQRLLSARCIHSPPRNLAVTSQRRLASGAAPRSPPPRSQPKPTNPRRAMPSINPSVAAAAERARINHEQEMPKGETPDEYKARYKSAARRWTSTVIALPILLVTSYYLFDRLALGHEQKVMNHEPTKRDD